MALDLLPVAPSPAARAGACCTPVTGATMDAEDAERTARTLKALADPARLRLLSILAAHEGGEACVCDLTEPVGLSQPTVSHHLKVLTEAGFVTREKRGVWAYYTLVPEAVADLGSHLGAHLGRATR
ncbi:metalloregulator ArsR/SmtB family transcription factor [Cellulomonas sp. C5510]|uniref:ArsR/SmtB family transcription factor n=1 Tax=Cellulomonas sp. C5510 TaxID=2871170 RepID=UPI001C94E3C7|nr:metalloregulator ArsR/SmtB family transcription factor [Cellulomonas sp. C5510]QZN85909.1 metalloregulator ArsR/SmtB family transcription factor [Cellulomonas sp. C5510]